MKNPSPRPLPPEREDSIDFTEEIERSWREYLQDFQRDVLPMFAEYGFTLPEAMAAWDTNKLAQEIKALREEM